MTTVAQFREMQKSRRKRFGGSLSQQVSGLEELARQTGAREVEQDEPGFFRRTIDVLSGLNYATAGFADELLQGRGIGAALGRASRELLSSASSLPFGSLLPEVEAEKETFGKVFEDAGFGTYTLGDVLPALEGTWLGNFVNTRGAVGLIADIALDPLSYFSFGAGGAVRRSFTGLGQKLLSRGVFSKQGDKLFQAELRALRGEVGEVAGRGGEDLVGFGRKLGLADDAAKDEIATITQQGLVFGREGRLLQATNAREALMRRAAFDRAVAKHGEDAILDPGGIKWMGKSVVTGQTIKAVRSKFSDPMVSALRQFEWGNSVMNGAETFYKGTRKAIQGIFHKAERLADLPANQMSVAVKAARRFRSGQAHLEGRLRERVINSDWWKFFQENTHLVEPAVNAIESRKLAGFGAGLGVSKETALQARQAARQMSEFFDEMGEDLVSLGIIQPEQFRKGQYFAHFFDNLPEEFSEVFAQWEGKIASLSGKHDQSRVYNTLLDARSISGLLNKIQTAARKAGIAVAKTPELQPSYVLDDVLGGYLRWYTQAKARRLFAKEMADTFGIAEEALTSEKIAKLFDVHTPRIGDTPEMSRIRKFIDEPGTSPVKRRLVETEDVIEADVSPRIFPTAGEPLRISRDRAQTARLADRITAPQRDNIRKALIALDNAPKDKGFTSANARVGTQLANKARIAALSDDELLEAQRIVLAQKERVRGLMAPPEVSKRIFPTATAKRRPVSEIPDLDFGTPGEARRLERAPRDLDVAELERSVTTPSVGEGKKSVLNPITGHESRFINGLTKEGRSEYFRRVLGEMNSDSQVVDFWRKYAQWADDLPQIKADLTGTTEEVFKKYGETASEYVLRGGNSMWGKDIVFMPRLIADYIDNANQKILNLKDWPALRAALKPIHWTNSWFKLGVYPLFPASGVRDAYSNLWFNSFRIGWHALDPKLFMQSIKVLSHIDGSPRTIKAMNKVMTSLGFDPEFIVTKSGRKIPVRDVARGLEQRNVTIGIRQILEFDPAVGRASITTRKARARVGVEKVVREVREPIDNASRVSLAVQTMIDDLGLDDAAEEVGTYLFHYNEIPEFSREVANTFIPFLRFTLKNIEFHSKLLKENPGAVINRLKAFRGREDERDYLAKWKAESLQIRLDSDGRTLRTITGVDLPTRNLDVLWRGNVRNTLRMGAGMLGPVWKVPLEQVTGSDLFTGSRRGRVNSKMLGMIFDGAPKPLKDWVGYAKRPDEAGRIQYSFDRQNLAIATLRAWMFSRLISTTDRQFREFLNEEGASAMFLDVLTGLRREDLNLDEQAERKLRRRYRQLLDSLQRRGVLPQYQVPGKASTEGLD